MSTVVLSFFGSRQISFPYSLFALLLVLPSFRSRQIFFPVSLFTDSARVIRVNTRGAQRECICMRSSLKRKPYWILSRLWLKNQSVIESSRVKRFPKT
uniref:Putative secreted protein n=1 Tax=Anopheles darlingi TaxID=43151 RepID=A0A2M4D606_ANODA